MNAADPLLALARRRGLITGEAGGVDAESALRAAGVGDDDIAALRLAVDVAAAKPAIPGYRVVERIGDGAYSNVWRAVQESMRREVALKIIPLRRPRDAERFLEEARAVGAVRHANVVACHEAGRAGESLFLAMELVRGGDAERLAAARGGRLDDRVVLGIARDAAQGLTALGEAGLLHRDVKPANILMDVDGLAKLADLGLAMRADPNDAVSARSTLAAGTPAYMSPEQARGERVDARSDIFSLGSTLFALATGRAPFVGDGAATVLARIADGPSPDPSAVLPEIPDDLRQVILAAMAHDRRHRYATAAELAEDAISALEGRAPAHARRLRARAFEDAQQREREATAPAARKAWLATAAALVAFALGIAGGRALVGPGAAERAEIATARQAATADGWRAYLRAHPRGEARAEADAAIAILDELKRRDDAAAIAGTASADARRELSAAQDELSRRRTLAAAALAELEAARAALEHP